MTTSAALWTGAAITRICLGVILLMLLIFFIRSSSKHSIDNNGSSPNQFIISRNLLIAIFIPGMLSSWLEIGEIYYVSIILELIYQLLWSVFQLFRLYSILKPTSYSLSKLSVTILGLIIFITAILGVGYMILHIAQYEYFSGEQTLIGNYEPYDVWEHIFGVAFFAMLSLFSMIISMIFASKLI